MEGKKGNSGKGKLTPRQRILAELFLKAECRKDTTTLARIYKEAGFKGVKASAAPVCLKILQQPHVQQYVKDLVEEVQKQRNDTRATIAAVIERFATWAHYDMRKLYNEDGSIKGPHELDDDIAACVLSYDVETTNYHNEKKGTDTEITKTKPKVINPKEAADSLARILSGGFGNDLNVKGKVEHEHTVKGGVMLVPAPMDMDTWIKMVPELQAFKDKQKKLIGFDEVVKVNKEMKK